MHLVQEFVLVLCIPCFFLVSQCAQNQGKKDDTQQQVTITSKDIEEVTGLTTTLSPFGCHIGGESKRLLTALIMTFVNSSSDLYGGIELDLSINAPFKKLIALCQKKAEELRLPFIGTEAYGECYGGYLLPQQRPTSSSDCINEVKQYCKESDKICVGKTNAMFIYELEKKPSMLPVGCFRDSRTKRLLKNHIRSYRDKTVAIYAGTSIDWRNFGPFLERIVMECYNLAAKEGYQYFGVEYYGECWAGNTLEDSKVKFADGCVDGNYKSCSQQEKFCSGKDNAIFVYEIIYH